MDSMGDLMLYRRFHYENARCVGFDPSLFTLKARGPRADPEFLEKMGHYLKYHVNMIRGGDFQSVEINGEQIQLGFAEIRVLAADGTVYAAPDMIYVHISERHYTPPDEFVSAVLNGPEPESESYQAFLARYDEGHCWGASDEYIALVDKAEALIRDGDAAGLRAFLGEKPEAMSLVARRGTLLNEAILSGQEGIAMDLIEASIPLDCFCGRELFTAAEKGMTTVVMALLDRGVPLYPDKLRNNPLFIAVAYQHNELAKQLYENRKDLVQKYVTASSGKVNIMQWCKICKNEDFLRYLKNRFRLQ